MIVETAELEALTGDTALRKVQEVYSGPEGRLWELLMGEQVHIGGFPSSMELADAAAIVTGSRGVDLCCCTGAGMRFLTRYRGVAAMTGVDATQAVLDLAKERSQNEGFTSLEFVLANACATGLPESSFDFVWGEDAWCYVNNKPGLIREAARLVKNGGVIAFTDWVTTDAGLEASEKERFEAFMKFPNMESLAGYSALLEAAGCEVLLQRDTQRFARFAKIYLGMLEQLEYDALKIMGGSRDIIEAIRGELQFVCQLAEQGKIAQGLNVARKM